MEDWSEIFSQIFPSHFLHQILRSSTSDVELLQKTILRNVGILRVEPTNQDVRELCLDMQMRCQKTGIKSTGRLSEGNICRIGSFEATAFDLAYCPNPSNIENLPPFKSTFRRHD